MYTHAHKFICIYENTHVCTHTMCVLLPKQLKHTTRGPCGKSHRAGISKFGKATKRGGEFRCCLEIIHLHNPTQLEILVKKTHTHTQMLTLGD